MKANLAQETATHPEVENKVREAMMAVRETSIVYRSDLLAVMRRVTLALNERWKDWEDDKDELRRLQVLPPAELADALASFVATPEIAHRGTKLATWEGNPALAREFHDELLSAVIAAQNPPRYTPTRFQDVLDAGLCKNAAEFVAWDIEKLRRKGMPKP